MGLDSSYLVEVGCSLVGWTSSVENPLGFDVSVFASEALDTAPLYLLQPPLTWIVKILTFWADLHLGVFLSVFRESS